MRATTVRDLGALVRSARRAQEMTQADLAARLGASRDWVVRLEQGHPRLEAQRVLDALAVLGLTLDVHESHVGTRPPGKEPTETTKTPSAKKRTAASAATKKAAPKTGRYVTKATAKKASSTKNDPFDALFKRRA